MFIYTVDGDNFEYLSNPLYNVNSFNNVVDNEQAFVCKCSIEKQNFVQLTGNKLQWSL